MNVKYYSKSKDIARLKEIFKGLEDGLINDLEVEVILNRLLEYHFEDGVYHKE